METFAPISPFDWANDAFLNLQRRDALSLNRYSVYDSFDPFAPSGFTTAPSRLSDSTLQITSRRQPATVVDGKDTEVRKYPVEVEKSQDEHTNTLTQSSKAKTLGQESNTRRNPKTAPQKQPSVPKTPSASTLEEQRKSANPQNCKRRRGRPPANPQHLAVNPVRRIYLEKNRSAAKKCRQRKKVEVEKLKICANESSSQNAKLKDSVATLQEEVLRLRTLILEHAGCGFWAMDKYLEECVKDLLVSEDGRLVSVSARRRGSQIQSEKELEMGRVPRAS